MERAAHWVAGLRMFEHHPFLGVGIGNYALAYPTYHVGSFTNALGHAHNYFINIAAETGVFGLAAYALFTYTAVWYALTIARARGPSLVARMLAVGLVGAWVSSTFHNLFDVLYVHAIPTLLGVLMGTLAVASGRSVSNSGDGHGDAAPAWRRSGENPQGFQPQGLRAASRTVEPRIVGARAGEPAIDAPEVADNAPGRSLSLGRRVRNWKTILSFVAAIGILAFVMSRAGINLSQFVTKLHSANWGYFFLAFVLYYMTFPLRAFRWRLLLRNAYRDDPKQSAVADMHLSGLTQIIYISWFVNCVVPAKLSGCLPRLSGKALAGDLWVKTMGTIVAERIVDILVLAALLAAAGLLAFHSRLGSIKVNSGLGLLLAVGGIVVLIMMRQFSPHIRRHVQNTKSGMPRWRMGRCSAFRVCR